MLLKRSTKRYQKNSYPIMLSTAIAAVSVRRMFGPRLTA